MRKARSKIHYDTAENINMQDIISEVYQYKQQLFKINRYLFDKSNRKILLMGDSHMRGIAALLKQIFPSFDIWGLVKPNARFGTIKRDIGQLLTHYTTQDLIIYMGGTNSTWTIFEEEEQLMLESHMSYIFKDKYVKFVGIPDSPKYRKNKGFTGGRLLWNRLLSAFESNYFNYIDIDSIHDEQFFTRDGLHLNSKGKLFLAHILASHIMEFLVVGMVKI